MNTSAKGASYENRSKAELYRRGAVLVMRAAASKGPFDLLAITQRGIEGYQCKNGGLTCSAAERLTVELLELTQTWVDGHFIPNVWHRTKKLEFCEH